MIGYGNGESFFPFMEELAEEPAEEPLSFITCATSLYLLLSVIAKKFPSKVVAKEHELCITCEITWYSYHVLALFPGSTLALTKYFVGARGEPGNEANHVQNYIYPICE